MLKQKKAKAEKPAEDTQVAVEDEEEAAVEGPLSNIPDDDDAGESEADTSPEPLVVSKPVSVKVDVEELPQIKRMRYFIGLRPECPLQFVDIAGISFPKVTQKISFDVNGETLRDTRSGSLVYLTDEQVEEVKKRVVTKLIRRHGNKAYVVTMTKRHQYDRNRDIPLANHVFMMEADQHGEVVRSLPTEPMMKPIPTKKETK